MAVSIRADRIVPRTGVRTEPFSIRNAELVDGIQITSAVLEKIDSWFMVLSVAKDVGRFDNAFGLASLPSHFQNTFHR